MNRHFVEVVTMGYFGVNDGRRKILRLYRLEVGADVVEDHDKAVGLELMKPQGAQAVGLVWPGEQIILSMGPEGGHSG